MDFVQLDLKVAHGVKLGGRQYRLHAEGNHLCNNVYGISLFPASLILKIKHSLAWVTPAGYLPATAGPPGLNSL